MAENKLEYVPRSFDIYGSKQKAVAVIEIPEEIKAYEAHLAEALMKVNKNIKSVLSKDSGRKGEYRTNELRLLAGDSDTEVLHKESGCFFRLDPMMVYFSPRESSERDRLVEVVKDGEDILVMFSGVGPLPIRVSKRHENIRVTSVELNPVAHNYCIENIHLNKVADKVDALQGDVKEVCPRLRRVYDRVMMPLPKGAYRFLDTAMLMLSDPGFLHFYHWAPEENLFSKAETLISDAAEAAGQVAEFSERVKVSQYSPGVWKVRVDALITRGQNHPE